MGLLPVQAALALHEVALLVLHFSMADVPDATVVGLTLRLIVGACVAANAAVLISRVAKPLASSSGRIFEALIVILQTGRLGWNRLGLSASVLRQGTDELL